MASSLNDFAERSVESHPAPELRKDPIVGRWVIIAAERGRRPIPARQEHFTADEASCPFCEGNEQETPGELFVFRNDHTEANGPGWRVRVVPNKFPALLHLSGELQQEGDGIYDRMSGLGVHEVIIECPTHETTLAALPEANVREVLWAYRERLVALKQDPQFVYGMVFKNVGAAAGASLEHTHSQLIVLPIVPISVQEEMTGSLQHYHHRQRCLFCDINHQEQSLEKRLVLESNNFVSYCPYASRFPFETWILPKRHTSHFEESDRSEIDELGTFLKMVLLKLESALDFPAYNFIIHTAPFDTTSLDHYHWHIEIIPRLTRVAGFEWGTGFYINPVPPEEAALILSNETVDMSSLSSRIA